MPRSDVDRSTPDCPCKESRIALDWLYFCPAACSGTDICMAEQCQVQGWPAARDSEGLELTRPPSELEIVGRAASTASARSIASFNSEEGFGSPQMRRRPAKRKGIPDVTTEHIKVGWGV